MQGWLLISHVLSRCRCWRTRGIDIISMTTSSQYRIEGIRGGVEFGTRFESEWMSLLQTDIKHQWWSWSSVFL
ncbi:hypothetical protein F5Y15DRAFT_398546 [Xylariaceae sp. FL0016]|nr:hypothetical protein F5Y15DRAFT_398546 [Xylariaceae sp. FL0016]